MADERGYPGNLRKEPISDAYSYKQGWFIYRLWQELWMTSSLIFTGILMTTWMQWNCYRFFTKIGWTNPNRLRCLFHEPRNSRG